jgi:hypothetical protein
MLFELAFNKNDTVANINGYNRFYLNFTRPLNDILNQQLFFLN